MVRIATILLVAAALLLPACAGPKVIVSAATQGRTVKFLTSEDGWAKTMIVCEAATDGTLGKCKEKKIEFRD